MTTAISFRTRSLSRLLALVVIPLAIFVLSATSCSTLDNWISHAPSADQVQQATIFVVSATREVVLAFGPAAETTLNSYIMLAHGALSGVIQAIQAGTGAVPAIADVQNYLTSLAKQFGSPSWMTNFIGNLVTLYQTKIYPFISKNSTLAIAYLTAFSNGTV